MPCECAGIKVTTYLRTSYEHADLSSSLGSNVASVHSSVSMNEHCATRIAHTPSLQFVTNGPDPEFSSMCDMPAKSHVLHVRPSQPFSRAPPMPTRLAMCVNRASCALFFGRQSCRVTLTRKEASQRHHHSTPFAYSFSSSLLSNAGSRFCTSLHDSLPLTILLIASRIWSKLARTCFVESRSRSV